MNLVDLKCPLNNTNQWFIFLNSISVNRLVVEHLHVHVKGSMGERHLWVRSNFSHIFCPFYLDGFRDGRYFVDVASRICSIRLVAFLGNFSQAFFLYTSLTSMWCIHWHDRSLEKLRFNFLDRFECYMIDNLSIAVHALASYSLMSFLVDEMLLQRQVDLFAHFREPPFCVEISPFWLVGWLSFMVYQHL